MFVQNIWTAYFCFFCLYINYVQKTGENDMMSFTQNIQVFGSRASSLILKNCLCDCRGW